MNVRLFAALSFTVSLSSVACAQSGADVSSVPPTAKPALVAGYGKLPLSFEANQGQVNEQVKFTSRGNGYSLFLTDTEAVLALTKPDPAARKGSGRPATLGAPFLPTDISSARVGPGHSKPKNAATDIVRMELAGTRHDLRVTGTEQLPGTANYFIGDDPSKWHSNVPTYAKVKYEGVYPGVDLVYYGNQRQLEYDFVVAPGADPKAVRLRFTRANRLKLDSNGDLRVIARNGEIAFHKPIGYQVVDGQRQLVAARFTLVAKKAVGFTLDSYDHSRELVIDPVLEYSTYLGGSSSDFAYGITVDASGNAYITGFVTSTDFPVTSGAYQRVNHGVGNAFITKLNSSGTGRVYSTYLGGSKGDIGQSIAVDAAGDALLTGGTSSTDFPVTPGALQMVNKAAARNTFNAFITKLNPSGTGLIYSTYLGGSGIGSGESALGDYGTSIVPDAAGDAFVTGYTPSTDFPTTSGAFQMANKAAANATINVFIAKLNPAGTGLIYSTYIGGGGGGSGIGSSGDAAEGLAVDAAGNTYAVGLTFSSDFPVTPGAFQVVNNAAAGAKDSAFITKLNPSGTALVYSTYLGGSGYNFGLGIAVDASGSAYLAGETTSTNFPVTGGAFQTVNNAAAAEGYNSFITKLNASGSGLIYSTYLGGSEGGNGFHYSVGLGIAVDASGSAYLAGGTTSTDFSVTSGAFQTVNNAAANNAANAFITKLNPAGTALIYSTYLGGSTDDYGYSIAVDAAGNAYVTGLAGSADFPVTSGAFQTMNHAANNGFNGFIAKLALGSFTNPPIPQISNISPDFGAPAAFVNITGSNFGTTQGNGYVTVGGGVSQVTAWSDTAITIRAPYDGSTGNVIVRQDNLKSNGVPFTLYPFPKVTGVSLATGIPGTPVTITGTNLLDGGGKASVTFNGTPATITSDNATSIQVTVPAGATSGRLDIEVNGVPLIALADFAVTPSLPHITAISPNYGAIASDITISGNFDATQGSGYVTVGGGVSQVTAWSSSQITTRAPYDGSIGNDEIIVRQDGKTSNGAPFTLYPFPTITNVSESSGAPGTQVTITGTNLLDGGGHASVTFNGTSATIVSDTATSIQVTVPPGATSGRVIMEVNNVALYALQHFTVNSID